MKTKYLLTFILTFYFSTVFSKNNIAFIENKGQVIDQNNHVNNSIKYIACFNGIKLELKNSSFSYEILHSEKSRKHSLSNLSKNLLKHLENRYGNITDSIIYYSHRIDIELLGANPNPELKAEGESEEYLNFYTTGTPETGVTYVHQYQKVTYQNIYPNIDLEFVLDATNKQPFKYNFIVHPGGKVSDIKLQYKGANNTKLTIGGSLIIATDYGNLEETIPSSFIAETGKDINVKYQQNGEDVYGFCASNYNLQQTLIIDPWCTYFGWNGGQSQGQIGSGDLVTDNGNNIYVIGTTDITTNVASIGAYQTVYGGGASDAFIRKFNSNGNPIWCTYYGGNDNDNASAIVCDEFSNIYLTGTTYSTNNIATSGSFLSSLPMTPWSSFLSKFNTNGIKQWGTYYPANSYRITNDHSNNIIIGGFAEDTSVVTPGAHQTIPGGNGDDFIAKFSSNGTRLWGTFYGGSELEKFTIDLSVDGQDNIFLSGTTSSTNNISTLGSFQQAFGGISDNFIVKFNNSGVRQWGTYYGGVGDEEHTTNIATDVNGDIYFVGEAESIGVFATAGAFQTNLGGALDYCLAKFNTSGQRLWSTYFGGSDDDQILSLKVDLYGNPIFVGSTLSSNNIGTLGSLQPNFTVGAFGWADDFIEKFNLNGSRIWGTYFGGTGNEPGASLTIDKHNNIIISGVTNSKGLATTGAYQTALIDTLYGDIFLASLDSNGTFTTGFGEVAPKTSLIQVYPNPAKEQITVSLTAFTGKKGSLNIMDCNNKLLKTLPIQSAETTVDLRGMAAGIYLLQYDDGAVCETVKVVKE